MGIIAAVDRTDRAKAVLEQAHRLAKAFDLPVYAVHVLNTSEFVELERTSVKETGKPIEMEKIKEVATDIAETKAAEVDGDGDVTAVGLVGSPSKEIVRYASDHDVQFIVVSPRKRSPTGKALFGSVAQSVLLNSTCPVITVTN
jgi:nucleotide-binding universal stress UspA family protein